MSMKIIAPIAAGVLLALAGAAQAATKTAGFQVSANVTTNCVISAADLILGTFDGTNNLTSTSAITVRCTNRTGYVVDLSTGSSGSFANRTLVNGGSSLVYNLYTAGDFTHGLGRYDGEHRPAGWNRRGHGYRADADGARAAAGQR